MDSVNFSWSPIYSGLIGGLAVFLMILFSGNKSKIKGGRRYLEYGLLFKGFCVLVIPLSLVIIYSVFQSYEGQEVSAFLVATGFLCCSIFLPYQAFFVKLSYDKDFVYFKSPIAGDKKAPWSDLEKVDYSWLVQADYIVVKGIGKIWCSNMLNGYGEFMDFISKLELNAAD